MQYRCPATQTFRREEAGDVQQASQGRHSQEGRLVPYHDRLQFDPDIAEPPCFHLPRPVFDATCQHGDPRRRTTQRTDFGQDTFQLKTVAPCFLQNQAAGCSAGLASSAAGVRERAFSSFIMGDGAVTARFMRMER